MVQAEKMVYRKIILFSGFLKLIAMILKCTFFILISLFISLFYGVIQPVPFYSKGT